MGRVKYSLFELMLAVMVLCLLLSTKIYRVAWITVYVMLMMAKNSTKPFWTIMYGLCFVALVLFLLCAFTYYAIYGAIYLARVIKQREES